MFRADETSSCTQVGIDLRSRMNDLENTQKKGNHTTRPISIIVAVTSALSWVFFEGTVEQLRDAGYEPILVSSPGEELNKVGRDAGFRYAAIPMRREISPLHDLLS